MSIPQEHIRTAMLVGEEALSRYCGARVAVFGVGGVGGTLLLQKAKKKKDVTEPSEEI